MNDLLMTLSLCWAIFIVCSVLAYAIYILDNTNKPTAQVIKLSLAWGISIAFIVFCTMLPFLLIKIYT